MEHISSETFLHIQTNAVWRDAPKLKIGDAFSTTSKLNPFIKFLYESTIYHEAYNLSHKVQNAYRSNNNVQIDSQIADFLATSLQHNLKIIREIIFESVRANEFPELPSRQTSMWVIPRNDKGNLDYWCKTLNNSKELLTLELTGTVHKVDESHLNQNNFTKLNDYYESARLYWSGTTRNGNFEFLFEGKGFVVDSKTI